MENKKITTGSALIAVLITIAVLTVIGGTVIRNTSLFYDLALQRVYQAQNTIALKSLLYYGVAYCKSLEKKDKKEQKYGHTFSHWPLHTSVSEGVITIVPNGDLYAIHVVLTVNNRVIDQKQAILTKEKTGWYLS